MDLNNAMVNRLAKLDLVRNELNYLCHKYDFKRIELTKDNSITCYFKGSKLSKLVIKVTDPGSHGEFEEYDNEYKAEFKNDFTGENSKPIFCNGLINILNKAINLYKEHYSLAKSIL